MEIKKDVLIKTFLSDIIILKSLNDLLRLSLEERYYNDCGPAIQTAIETKFKMLDQLGYKEEVN